MSEEFTKNLPQRGTIAQTDAHLASLEEKIDEWLDEEKSMWERVLQKLISIESKLDEVKPLMNVLNDEVSMLRLRVEELEDAQQRKQHEEWSN
ncbi:MAG: hypothetical protein AUG51_10885 [Acidobacteria bacterium 13_1_20CM_3_53_8]|nr:MAG: hypothetical protein AUG51_10885 [Acidobacteria bacterium 13_1_20CM_3_53_8]